MQPYCVLFFWTGEVIDWHWRYFQVSWENSGPNGPWQEITSTLKSLSMQCYQTLIKHYSQTSFSTQPNFCQICIYPKRPDLYCFWCFLPLILIQNSQIMFKWHQKIRIPNVLTQNQAMSTIDRAEAALTKLIHILMKIFDSNSLMRVQKLWTVPDAIFS